MYTDYHRLGIIHTVVDDVPEEVLQALNLVTDEGQPASTQQRRKDLPGFIAQSSKIARSYFISQKGIRLGCTKAQAKKAYDWPPVVTRKGKLEKWNWTFEGDYVADSTRENRRKPVAQDQNYPNKKCELEKRKAPATLGLLRHKALWDFSRTTRITATRCFAKSSI